MQLDFLFKIFAAVCHFYFRGKLIPKLDVQINLIFKTETKFKKNNFSTVQKDKIYNHEKHSQQETLRTNISVGLSIDSQYKKNRNSSSQSKRCGFQYQLPPYQCHLLICSSHLLVLPPLPVMRSTTSSDSGVIESRVFHAFRVIEHAKYTACTRFAGVQHATKEDVIAP